MKYTDIPGKELPKEYREIALELRMNQGWGYRNKTGHPVLFSPDGVMRVTCPQTPSDRKGFPNFLSAVRRGGGRWPPGGKAKS